MLALRTLAVAFVVCKEAPSVLFALSPLYEYTLKRAKS
jgi:hypothetical protein